MLTEVLGRTCEELLVTLLSVTVICCTSDTRLRLTVIVLPETVGLPEIYARAGDIVKSNARASARAGGA